MVRGHQALLRVPVHHRLEEKRRYHCRSEIRVQEFIKLGDFWYDNYLSIPLLWVFGKAVFNPSVLEGYEVSHVHFGPVRYHEYTVPIYK